MFCPNCGEKIEDEWNVCPNCGKKLKVGDTTSILGSDDEKDVNQKSTLQNSNTNKKTGAFGKIVGWGLTIFNIIFAIIVISESIIGSLCLLGTAVFFCPKTWEKTNKKYICIVLGIAMCFIGWISFLISVGEDSIDTVPVPSTENSKDIKSNIVQSSEIESNENNDNYEYNKNYDVSDGEIVKDEETEASEFYPTDKVDCGDWYVTVWVVWTSYDEFWGNQKVNCLCDITNKSGDVQTFNSSDILELDNNGVLGEASSDYDGQRITSGTDVRMIIAFNFPDKSNIDLSSMKLNGNGKNILFTAKPQTKENIKKFEGTYECGEMKMVFIEQSPNIYHLFDYNPVSGVEESTISIDENNRFKIGACEYIWIPEESAIYVTDVDGNPDRETYYFVKTNLEKIEMVPREEVELGDIYYFAGGATLSLTKKGQEGNIIVYTLMADNKAHIEFKGTFEYQDDMTNLVPINVEEEYSNYVNEKIAFPDGTDNGRIIISETTLDDGLEFLKE